jgi:uncharacterized membrane protein
MKTKLNQNTDFWAGVMFAGTGAAALWGARGYPLGSTLNMGPGYFPTLLGGLLVVFGLVILVRGLRRSEKIQAGWSIRALVVLPLAVVAFGLLMAQAGFVPAMAALVVLSAAAGRQFRLKEVLLLALFLTALTVILFVWGLGLPYPLVKSG